VALEATAIVLRDVARHMESKREEWTPVKTEPEPHLPADRGNGVLPPGASAAAATPWAYGARWPEAPVQFKLLKLGEVGEQRLLVRGYTLGRGEELHVRGELRVGGDYGGESSRCFRLKVMGGAPVCARTRPAAIATVTVRSRDKASAAVVAHH